MLTYCMFFCNIRPLLVHKEGRHYAWAAYAQPGTVCNGSKARSVVQPRDCWVHYNAKLSPQSSERCELDHLSSLRILLFYAWTVTPCNLATEPWQVPAEDHDRQCRILKRTFNKLYIMIMHVCWKPFHGELGQQMIGHSSITHYIITNNSITHYSITHYNITHYSVILHITVLHWGWRSFAATAPYQVSSSIPHMAHVFIGY
jgi:hypothetical protein